MKKYNYIAPEVYIINDYCLEILYASGVDNGFDIDDDWYSGIE